MFLKEILSLILSLENALQQPASRIRSIVRRLLRRLLTTCAHESMQSGAGCAQRPGRSQGRALGCRPNPKGASRKAPWGLLCPRRPLAQGSPLAPGMPPELLRVQSQGCPLGSGLARGLVCAQSCGSPLGSGLAPHGRACAPGYEDGAASARGTQGGLSPWSQNGYGPLRVAPCPAFGAPAFHARRPHIFGPIWERFGARVRRLCFSSLLSSPCGTRVLRWHFKARYAPARAFMCGAIWTQPSHVGVQEARRGRRGRQICRLITVPARARRGCSVWSMTTPNASRVEDP